MPHIIVEHSANLADHLAVDGLLSGLHAAALETGIFPLGGLRSRAAERTLYRIADGDPDNAFVHVVLRIGHGRDLATKKRAGQHIFAALTRYLDPVFAKIPLAISMEIQEIDPDLNFKHNNLHDHVRRRQASG